MITGSKVKAVHVNYYNFTTFFNYYYYFIYEMDINKSLLAPMSGDVEFFKTDSHPKLGRVEK